METEEFKVTDKHGFIYRVDLKYHPGMGVASAEYKGRVINAIDTHKLREPMSDNDAEWERYHENLEDWKSDVKTDIEPACVEYFNRK